MLSYLSNATTVGTTGRSSALVVEVGHGVYRGADRSAPEIYGHYLISGTRALQISPPPTIIFLKNEEENLFNV
jgi:hypothetical protein